MREASVGHQCPECVALGRRTQRPARTAFGGSAAGQQGYVTKALIAINCLLLLISAASAHSPGNALGGGQGLGLLGGETPLMDRLAVVGLIRYGQFDPTVHGVAQGEYYRLITAMFMHYGVLHLGLNMYALWILGRQLEQVLGPARFLALYLVSGLGGNVAAYVFQPNGLSAGASTALFGLFAALVLVVRRLGGSIAPLIPILAINFIFTFSVPGISIAGHLGGFVTGGIVGAGLAYAPRANRTVIQATVVGLTLVALVALSLWKTSAIGG